MGRKTDLKLPFDRWQRALMEQMEHLAPKIGPKFKGGPLVDARVPYDWGWTPYRAARAYLGLTYSDYVELGDSQIGLKEGDLKKRDKVKNRGKYA